MKFFNNFTIKIVKMNFIYVRSPPNIILIEITKFFLLLFGVCIYITYQIKKCIYNKKAYVCVCGVVLINILELQLGPPKQKFLAPLLLWTKPRICFYLEAEAASFTWSPLVSSFA